MKASDFKVNDWVKIVNPDTIVRAARLLNIIFPDKYDGLKDTTLKDVLPIARIVYIGDDNEAISVDGYLSIENKFRSIPIRIQNYGGFEDKILPVDESDKALVAMLELGGQLGEI